MSALCNCSMASRSAARRRHCCRRRCREQSSRPLILLRRGFVDDAACSRVCREDEHPRGDLTSLDGVVAASRARSRRLRHDRSPPPAGGSHGQRTRSTRETPRPQEVQMRTRTMEGRLDENPRAHRPGAKRPPPRRREARASKPRRDRRPAAKLGRGCRASRVAARGTRRPLAGTEDAVAAARSELERNVDEASRKFEETRPRSASRSAPRAIRRPPHVEL